MLCEINMTDNKLNNTELDILVIRTQHLSSAELQDALKRSVFSIKEVPYIEGYIPHKIEEERNAPVTLYHHSKAPDGKIFKTYEIPLLEKKGWVDTPNKFRKSIIITKAKSLLLKYAQPAQNKITKNTDYWYKKPVGIVIISVLSIIIAAFVVFAIRHYFPNLKLLGF